MSEASSSHRVVSTERFEALRREYRLRTATDRSRMAHAASRTTDATGPTHTTPGSRES